MATDVLLHISERPVPIDPLGIIRDCPIEQIFIQNLSKIDPNLFNIYSKQCLPVYNRPQDVSGNVDGMPGIKFALGIS